MPTSITASHTITIDLPIDACQRLFTPAGEELWVDGWQPRWLEPADGRTVQGMVFTTGSGDDLTVWTLMTWTQNPHRARYARVTPASRWGFVDVACDAQGASSTNVTVSYTLHALNGAGEQALEAFAPTLFAEMIDGWKADIDGRIDQLRVAVIR